MIDNETVRKASEIGIIDVVDAIKLIETNPAYITLTFDEKINIFWSFLDLFAKISRNLFVFMRMYTDCLDGGGRAFIPGKMKCLSRKSGV